VKEKKNGVDYYFTTVEDFQKKISAGEFLEYNVYDGNYYGTERKYLEKRLGEYDIVFSLIEVNGKHQLEKNKVPHFSIFLLPESLEVLKKRIEKRGGLSDKSIEERLKIAKNEIKASKYYDYVITNKEGHLQETVEQVRQIVKKILAGEKIKSLTNGSN
jgi:guanylate kinase